jgi:putative colanic acid biosynthesis UDP-glucose lipid carrier transferase
MPEVSARVSAAGGLPHGLRVTIAPHDGDRLLRALHALVDPVAAAVSLWALAWLIEGTLALHWLLLSVLAFALAFPERTPTQAPLGAVAARLLASWSWVVLVLWLAGLVMGRPDMLASRVLLHWLWVVPLVQLAAHVALWRAAPWLLRLQGAPQQAVVVGMNAQGQVLARRLRQGARAGITLVGWFDDRHPARLPADDTQTRLGTLAEVAGFIKAHRIHRVYLSLPMASQPRIQALLEALKDTTASVYFVPDLFVTDLIQGRADSVCGMPVISVCDTPFRGPAGLIKRASDLVLASAILLMVSPLMVALAVVIKCTSPGPVIFRQRRYGLDGQEIVVYKFRSMTVVEDGPTIVQAQRGDTRITRLGAFMRRTSLDELPQFINVLQGRMSVVGPRPHAVAHNELYRSQIRSYMVRHKVRPGITGWAQVHGFRGETQSLDLMQARVRMDLDYLRHWSLALDLVIIARTVRLVFRDSAAF